MVNCNIYINRKKIVDVDLFTATYEDGKRYIWSQGERAEFFRAWDEFGKLQSDEKNMFTTYEQNQFIFLDCRREL